MTAGGTIGMTEHLTSGTRRTRAGAWAAGPLRGGRSRTRGQSLIVAVIVLFVLLFVGGVFVGLVAHNLISEGRAADTLSAAQLAEAGANYAGDNLRNSLEGADWRPAPTPWTNAQDPDRPWLDQGFSRISLPSGRALIRVSYKTPVPYPQDPAIVRPNFAGYGATPSLDPTRDRTILIESVGRVGRIDEQDPTTFLNIPTPRLRRVVLAKMAIGLTDYLRYVTNINREANFEARLGVPPISIPNPSAPPSALPLWMQLGGLPIQTPDRVAFAGRNAMGGSIQVNGDLALMNNTVLALNPALGDRVTVSGAIRVASGSAAADPADPSPRTARINDLSRFAPNADPVRDLPEIRPSSDPQFDTFGQLLMDSGIGGLFDRNGLPRQAQRLDPPAIDRLDPATGVARYLAASRDSGVWLPRDNPSFNTGRLGWGSGVYINNPSDLQTGVNGPATTEELRGRWLNPGSNGEWIGPFYIPPGVVVEFGYFVVNDPRSGLPVEKPGFKVTFTGVRGAWRDPLGRVTSKEQVFTFFIYKPAGQRPVIKLDTELYRAYLRANAGNPNILPPGSGSVEDRIDRFLPPFNGVIYAAGNIRTRGLLPAKAGILNDATRTDIRRDPDDGSHLTDNQIRALSNAPSVTMVSGGNIYIEGSLVREPSGPDTMLALLAMNNVVINTTLFVGPDGALPTPNGTPGVPPYFDLDANSPGRQSVSLQWLFGADPTGYTSVNGGGVSSYLLVRHGVDAQSVTFMNLAVNEAPTLQLNATPYYPFKVISGAPTVYSLPLTPSMGAPGSTEFEQRAFRLCDMPPSGSAIPDSHYVYTGLPYPWPEGLRNTLRFSMDPYIPAVGTPTPYHWARAAVVPLDVRIEAVLYAQYGSFFVIPGPPMNEQQDDTRDEALRNGGGGGRMRRPGVDPSNPLQNDVYDMYPFYNEPIDVRITIVGAVSENKTASEGDQAAWMQLWGWIPQNYGSTGFSASSPQPIEVPKEHLWVGEVGNTPADYRSEAEKNYYGSLGITRGIRFLYDPALYMPFAGYSPNGSAFRVDDYGRVLPPVPRLPVCPNFVFFGEVR